jgi:hypothetical protein
MSNNEDMEVNVDRDHGLQGMVDNNKSHDAKGNKSGTRGVNEKEREQVQREKGKNPINIIDKQDTSMTKTRRTGPPSEATTKKTSIRTKWHNTA